MSLPRSSAHLHGLEHFALGAGIFAGRARRQPGGDHQRRAVVGVRHLRIGAERGQRAHQLGVGGARGQQERRRADRVQTRVVRHSRACVMRALRFAPCATSFLTSSRLVMLPDPSGAGSLSPPPGLRTDGNRVQRRVARTARHSDRRRHRAATPPARSAHSRPPDAAALVPAARRAAAVAAPASARPAWSRSRPRRP